jgi:hypothetical protein
LLFAPCRACTIVAKSRTTGTFRLSAEFVET